MLEYVVYAVYELHIFVGELQLRARSCATGSFEPDLVELARLFPAEASAAIAEMVRLPR
jgi:hypothetical protein